MAVFSALERFHFIVMETQSGETSSCQGTADTQDLWWKIKHVQSHPDPHIQLMTSNRPQSKSKSQYITPKSSFSWQRIYTAMHISCIMQRLSINVHFSRWLPLDKLTYKWTVFVWCLMFLKQVSSAHRRAFKKKKKRKILFFFKMTM